MRTELIEVVKELKQLEDSNTKFLDILPTSLFSITDNEYVNNQQEAKDLLIRALFKENTEDIFWFLFEWEKGKKTPQIYLESGEEIILETEDDYYQYLEKYC
jgi:hypothetical protein